MIRVLVAASSAVIRAGLEQIVRSSPLLELAGSAELASLPAAHADVLLVDAGSLSEDVLAVVTDFQMPAVLLTAADSPGPALRAGFRSVLPRHAAAEEIEAAVQAAAAGLVSLEAEAAAALFSDIRPVVAFAPETEHLTAREIEVLNMLASGLSNKLIAHGLGISEHTVKFHVASVMSKLHAASRTDAVMQGIRRGLVMV